MRFSFLHITAFSLALVFSIPILSMVMSWFFPASDSFSYLYDNGLVTTYVRNSLLIASLTGFFALIIGVGCAWLVTAYSFPLRSVLNWMLILPFAMPPYVAAMLYGDLFESAGPVQTLIRDITGLSFGEYWFPQIRSLGGVVFVLTVTLYPYVYLLARTAFLMQSRQMLETGEMLGLSPAALFYRVALPVARPALITGIALVMMEALADYGVVALYGIPAFTTGIYRIWQGFYDPIAAAKLASMLLLFVLGLIWTEKKCRGKARYHNMTGLYHPLRVRTLPSFQASIAAILCFFPVLLGFVIPLCMTVNFSVWHYTVFLDNATWQAALNALKLAFLTASMTSVIGLLFAYALRDKRSYMLSSFISIATAGYAIPGSIIAIGVLLFLVTLQNELLAGEVFLTGTLLAVVWGCTLRFLTISFKSAESGLVSITPTMDCVATTLGTSRFQIISKLHLPLVKISLLSGFLLVFVDTIKELPATLLLRPFNFDTLAIRTYELANDDLLVHAAPTALLLVLISLFPVWLLNRKINDSRPGGVYA